MQIEDYDQVYALWMTIHGFSIRTIDDSREGVERFLKVVGSLVYPRLMPNASGKAADTPLRMIPASLSL